MIQRRAASSQSSDVTSVENTAVECLSLVDLYALLGPDATGYDNWTDANDKAAELGALVTELGAVNAPYPDAPLTVTAPGEESGTFDSFVELVIAKVGKVLTAFDEAFGVQDVRRFGDQRLG